MMASQENAIEISEINGLYKKQIMNKEQQQRTRNLSPFKSKNPLTDNSQESSSTRMLNPIVLRGDGSPS
jgi:hypothetical protein